jgi:hypothetical protein
LKIIENRTIGVSKIHSKVGLVTEIYSERERVTIGTFPNDEEYTLDKADFVPILNLRQEADLMLNRPAEVVEKNKGSILRALVEKFASLANEIDRIKEITKN